MYKDARRKVKGYWNIRSVEQIPANDLNRYYLIMKRGYRWNSANRKMFGINERTTLRKFGVN